MEENDAHTDQPEGQEMAGAAFAGLRLLEDGAIITEGELATIFDKHPASIKRAVERGELPPSTRFMGKPVWTVGAIRTHIGERLDEEKRAQQQLQRKVTRLSP